ncbi:TOMM precursor leader peptide-binding protein [Streptomyces sp. NPDC020379]|uniref:TOMM precursor leader peptide-binding protein n=1 Tax=Streptomyces sp. NPDC020379 TaxID=3365071 RepID=UPI0037A0BB3A
MNTPAPPPLAAAANALQRLLGDRFRQETRENAPQPPGAAGHPPLVVPLGVTDALQPEKDTVTGRARATVHLTPHTVLIGPWLPGRAPGTATTAPCGRCLAMRWQRLRPRYEREALEFGHGVRAVGPWPPLTGYLADAVWRAFRHSAQEDTHGAETGGHTGAATEAGPTGPPGSRPHPPEVPTLSPHTPRVTRVDLDTLATRTYPLLADPLCPDCGAHRSPDDAPGTLDLRPRPKPGPALYRQRSPEDYDLPAEALANPVCGALGPGTLRNVTSPTTAPVLGTILMRGHVNLTDMTWSGQANSFRRSRSLAFLEGLERYAGTRRRNRADVLVAPYNDVAPDALDPRACGSYGPLAYEQYPQLHPFDPAQPIPWVWGHSLRDDRPVLVPVRLSYYSTGTAADNFVFESSNGCASGGSPEEAILFGLLELIERDAFLLGWYGGAELTRIDLTTVHDPELRAMIDRAELCDYEVRAFDNRVDLSTPVVTGVAVRRHGGDGALSFAAGASPDPATAVRAAVSEILTYLPALSSGVASRRPELLAMTEDFSRVRYLRDHAALFGLPEMKPHARRYLRDTPPVPFTEVYGTAPMHARTSPDLLEDLNHCRDELTDAGFDVIVVDQTCPEQQALGLHTMCTIVPGLLPIDFGWAQQRAPLMPRMRTAFRRAGWRDTDLTEAELHHVPHPFP